MGLFDSLKNMFAHREAPSWSQHRSAAHSRRRQSNMPLLWCISGLRTCARWRMQSKQLQDEMPPVHHIRHVALLQRGLSACRFQSKVASSIDADAIATAFAETTVLRDECEIQHLMGDIETTVSIADPAKTPARYRLTNSIARHR